MRILLACICFCFTVTGPVFAVENLDTANALFLKDDTDGTIRECEKLISTAADKELKAQAYYIMGQSFLRQSKFAGARADFEIILNEFGDTQLTDYAASGVADSYFMEGNFQNALAGYETILSKNAKAQFRNLLQFKTAKCLQKLGRWEDAKTLFSKIRSEYPLSFEAKLSQDILNENLFYFSIQVGAFTQQRRADRFCESLKRKGYDAFVSPTNKDNQAYYRVRVGRLNSQEETNLLAEKLKSEGYPVKIYP